MNKKIRIGILGAGEMAKKHLVSLARVDGAEIAGVSGAGAESLAVISNKYGAPVFENRTDLLPRCDAVDICLPTFLHEEATLAAAAAGLHVICEKPMAMTVAEAENMIRACGAAGVKLMIAHCLRFWPEYVFLKDAVESGMYGKLQKISCRRFGGFPARTSRPWLTDAEKSGGPTLDLHIHDLDLIAWIAGMPDSVRAIENKRENAWTVFSELTYGNGLTARAGAGWFMEEGYEFRQGYRAVFEDAVIEFSSENKETPLLVFRNGTEAESPPLPGAGDDAYVAELKYFTECARVNAEPSRSSGPSGSKALRLALAAAGGSGETVLLG